MAFKAHNSGFTGKNFDSFDPDISNFDPGVGRKVNRADGGEGGARHGAESI